MRRVSLVLSASLALACTSQISDADTGSDASVVPDADTVDAYRAPHDAGPHIDVGTTDRPAPVLLPMGFDGTTPMPLIVVLHADGATGPIEQMLLHIGAAASTSGAIVVLPTGTLNPGSSFLLWNDGITTTTSADDVAYLGGVLDRSFAMLPVDRHRVYFVGHANSAFMAYRMACAEAARITGIIAIDGGDYPSSTQCTPTRAVSVLDIHGTADPVFAYDGVTGVFAGAVESTTRWAQRASCDTSMSHMPAAFDLDAAVAGPETTATDYIAGCTGARVSLYTMTGSGHIPGFTAAAGQDMVDWLLARSSP